MWVNKIDHSGEVHERLTLLRKGEPYISQKTGRKYERYYCSCNCGKYTENNPKLIKYQAIKHGNTKSCGCLVKDKSPLNNKTLIKKYNVFDMESNEYGIGYTFKGEEFYFDKEDYDKIKEYCWYISNNGYVRAKALDGTGKHVSFHAVLFSNFSLNLKDVDHKNHNKKDNRKHNLRIVTRSQNNMNRKLFSNNTSGVTGVCWNKAANKWAAHIRINKKRIHLGYFNDFEDAVKARKEAEEKYFGEFSYDNSVKEGGANNVDIF